MLPRDFGIHPPPCARNLQQECFRDKTAYNGLLTKVEGPLQPRTNSSATLSITILSFGIQASSAFSGACQVHNKRLSTTWIKFIYPGQQP